MSARSKRLSSRLSGLSTPVTGTRARPTRGRPRNVNFASANQQEDEDSNLSEIVGLALSETKTLCVTKTAWRLLLNDCINFISDHTVFGLAEVKDLCNSRTSSIKEIKSCVAMLGESLSGLFTPGMLPVGFQSASSKQSAIILRAMAARFVFLQCGDLEELEQPQHVCLSACLRAAGASEASPDILRAMVEEVAFTLNSAEDNTDMLLFILEDALLKAKKRVTEHSRFNDYFAELHPGGSASIAADAAGL